MSAQTALDSGRPPTRLSRSFCIRMIAICFLAQNFAMGLAFGSFGPLLASNEAHFGINRAAASTGMSLLTLAVGLLSPFFGNLLQRVSVRNAMIGGAVSCALGYWGLALTDNYYVALASYVVTGAGTCLLGILGPLTMISRWFDENRAKILSFVNLPFALLISPYFIADLLPYLGRMSVVGGLGTLFLILIPLLWLLADPPSPFVPPKEQVSTPQQEENRAFQEAPLFRSARFWLLSLGMGLMTGTGSVFFVHAVAYGTTKALSLQAASAIVSIYAAAGLGGTLIFGWMADRIGPPMALVISAICQAVMWFALLHSSEEMFFPIAAILGLCSMPMMTLHGAAISTLFGAHMTSKAMGLSYFIKVPFVFGFAPFVGLLFDRLGGYDVAFLFCSASMAAAALLFVFLLKSVRQPSGTAT